MNYNKLKRRDEQKLKGLEVRGTAARPLPTALLLPAWSRSHRCSPLAHRGQQRESCTNPRGSSVHRSAQGMRTPGGGWPLHSLTRHRPPPTDLPARLAPGRSRSLSPPRWRWRPRSPPGRCWPPTAAARGTAR